MPVRATEHPLGDTNGNGSGNGAGDANGHGPGLTPAPSSTDWPPTEIS